MTENEKMSSVDLANAYAKLVRDGEEARNKGKWLEKEAALFALTAEDAERKARNLFEEMKNRNV